MAHMGKNAMFVLLIFGSNIFLLHIVRFNKDKLVDDVRYMKFDANWNEHEVSSIARYQATKNRPFGQLKKETGESGSFW